MKIGCIAVLGAALAAAQVFPQGARNILTYSTYLGGTGVDIAHAVSVDAQGNVYVVGETASPDFPVTPDAFQPRHAGMPGGPSQEIEVAAVAPGYPPVGPGIFSADASGSGQAAAFNQDGTANGPDHPAPAGSVVGLYATGLGATIPGSTDGQITGPSLLPVISGAVETFVGGQKAEVSYAGAAPYSVAGVSQVNFVVPAVSGTVPVFLSAGHTVASQSGVWITVR